MSAGGARARGLVRDYAALVAGELVAKLLGFLGFAWLARALGPESYGPVELAAALVMVCGLVVDFGLGPIGAREIAARRTRAAALAARIPALRLALCAPALAAMGAALLALDLSADARRLVALYALSLLAGPWTLNWLFQGLDLVRWVALSGVLRMGVFAAGAVWLVRGPEHLWRVGAVELAAAAAMAVYFAAAARWRAGVPLRLAFAPPPDEDAGRGLLREALPVGASQILWMLNQYLPTLLLAVLASSAALAFYGGAHRIVMALGTFVYLYFFNLYPALVRATRPGAGPADDFAGLARGSFRVTAWLGTGGALGATLVAGPAVRLAYGDAFADAAAPFALLAWVLPASLLSGHARYALIAAGHQRLELGAQAAGVVVGIGLGVPLVAAAGPLGAAATLLASTLLVWAVAHRFAVRTVGALPWWGPLWRPGLAAAAALALAAAATPALEAQPLGAWLAAALALALYAAALPLLDRRLLRDLGRLARGAGAEMRYTNPDDGRRAPGGGPAGEPGPRGETAGAPESGARSGSGKRGAPWRERAT